MSVSIDLMVIYISVGKVIICFASVSVVLAGFRVGCGCSSFGFVAFKLMVGWLRCRLIRFFFFVGLICLLNFVWMVSLCCWSSLIFIWLSLVLNWFYNLISITLKLLWNCSEIRNNLYKLFQEWLMNFQSTALKLLWNCSETALKLEMN